MSTSRAEIDQGPTEAIDIVETFLAQIGDGQLDSAQMALAPDARITFPGNAVHADLAAMRAASRSRYRWVNKHRDDYIAHERGDGTIHVISTGRVYGENLHGVFFDGVRYVDLFVLKDGLIIRQDVYNDLAETGILDVTSADQVPTGLQSCGAHP